MNEVTAAAAKAIAATAFFFKKFKKPAAPNVFLRRAGRKTGVSVTVFSFFPAFCRYVADYTPRQTCFQ